MFVNRIITLVNQAIIDNENMNKIKYFKIDDNYFKNYDAQYGNELWDLKTKISVEECKKKAEVLHKTFENILTTPLYSNDDEYKPYLDRIFYDCLDSDISLSASKLISADNMLFERLKYNLPNFTLEGEDKTKLMYVYNLIDYLSYSTTRVPPIPLAVVTSLILKDSNYDYVIPINNSNENSNVNNFNVELLEYRMKVGNKNVNIKSKLHIK
jgi:hypothetical protein